MVFPWMGWYSNFMCQFATLGHKHWNFQKTFNSTQIDYMNCALCFFSLEIVKEPKNHHQLASFLQISFSCTKDVLDKHNVPASRRKVFCLQDTHFSQTKWNNWPILLILGSPEIKQIVWWIWLTEISFKAKGKLKCPSVAQTWKGQHSWKRQKNFTQS